MLCGQRGQTIVHGYMFCRVDNPAIAWHGRWIDILNRAVRVDIDKAPLVGCRIVVVQFLQEESGLQNDDDKSQNERSFDNSFAQLI